MNRASWAHPVTADEAHRRAGGRRRYNAARHMAAILRRIEVLKLMAQGLTGRQIAACLDVHESVVSRDRRRLKFMQWRPELRDALIYATVSQVDRLNTGSMAFPDLFGSRQAIEAVLNCPAAPTAATDKPANTASESVGR